MGLLDIFKKKEHYHKTNYRIRAMHDHVQDAFNTVHENVSTIHGSVGSLYADVSKQKEWLKYLHQLNLSIKDQHVSHRETTQTELTKVNSWITFLHKATQKQEKHLAKMQVVMAQTLETYNAQLKAIAARVEETHKKASERLPQIIEKKIEVNHDSIKQAVLSDLILDMQMLQRTLRQELEETLTSTMKEQYTAHKQSVQEILNELEANRVAVVAEPIQRQLTAPEVREIIVPSASLLTNPEQKLLNVLINGTDPLSYTKISQLTGHSINTVRVNMNVLKKKGLVEESTLPTGIKLFSVTNKEKVKKMYNVSVL